MSIEAGLFAAVKRDAATRIVPAATRALLSDLDRTGPRRTGRMLRQRSVRRYGRGDTVGVELIFRAPYAGMLDQGLKAHVIRPRRAKALRFVVGGQVVFARKVNWRPGAGAARAKGWFTNRAKAWRRYLQDAA